MTGPAVWGALLNQLRDHGNTLYMGQMPLIVAGGAVRDYMLSLPNKDIDVITAFDSISDFEEFVKGLPANFSGDIHEYDEDYTNDDPLVNGVWSGTWVHNDVTHSVDIISRPIAAKGGEALVKQFDLGLCQVWWDPSESPAVQWTQAHMEDVMEDRCTLMHGRHPEDSYHRFTRWKERTGSAHTWHDPNNFKPQQELFEDIPDA